MTHHSLEGSLPLKKHKGGSLVFKFICVIRPNFLESKVFREYVFNSPVPVSFNYLVIVETHRTNLSMLGRFKSEQNFFVPKKKGFEAVYVLF